MPKRIREGEDIYIAPDILGVFRDGQYLAIDERSNNILNPNEINSKIIIYERQVDAWFLHRATKFSNSENNGFIVLMICMSYLEGVEQYRQGQSSENGNSNYFFRQAIHRLYPGQYEDELLKRLYRESRCGLFHNGMVGGDIIINSNFSSPLKFIDQDIKISPKKLLHDIKEDFKKYIKDLKNENNIEMRNKFNSMFSNT